MEAQKKYTKIMKEAKIKSWKGFCNTIKDKNPFTLPYKIAANQLKKPIIVTPVSKDDGTLTKTTEESIEVILKRLYNLANLDSKSPEKEHYEVIQEDGVTFEDKEFTERDDYVFSNLKTHIAAGPDQLQTSFIQALYKIHKAVFFNIFNSCLRLGIFPTIWKISKVINSKR